MITQLGGIGSPDAYIFKVWQGQNLGSRSYDRREQAVLTDRYLTEATGGLEQKHQQAGGFPMSSAMNSCIWRWMMAMGFEKRWAKERRASHGATLTVHSQLEPSWLSYFLVSYYSAVCVY